MLVSELFEQTKGRDLFLPVYSPDGGAPLQGLYVEGLYTNCIRLIFADKPPENRRLIRCISMLELAKQLENASPDNELLFDKGYELERVEYVEDTEYGDYWEVR